MQAIRLALRVRIRREAVGKRLAQRDIFQRQACEYSRAARNSRTSLLRFRATTRGTVPQYHALRTRHRGQSPVSWLACPTAMRLRHGGTGHSLGGERANSRAQREIPVIRFSLALLHQYFFCFSINTGRHPHRMAPCCIFVFYSSDPQSDSRFVSRIPTPMNRSVRPG